MAENLKLPSYEMRFCGQTIAGPYKARSASNRTEDWPFWYVTPISDGQINCLRFEGGQMFTSRALAELIAEDANRQTGHPMTEAKRKITRDEYLKALAFITLANSYYRKSREYERAMAEMFWPDDPTNQGFLCQAIYSDETVTIADFDRALKYDSLESAPVEDTP